MWEEKADKILRLLCLYGSTQNSWGRVPFHPVLKGVARVQSINKGKTSD